MAFDWLLYLELARVLADQGDEASNRTAISRAYYAVFCSIRNRLKRRGSLPRARRGRSRHRTVWNHLRASERTHEKSLGEWGARLQNHRQRADYEDTLTDLPRMVETALLTAEQMLEGATRL